MSSPTSLVNHLYGLGFKRLKHGNHDNGDNEPIIMKHLKDPPNSIKQGYYLWLFYPDVLLKLLKLRKSRTIYVIPLERIPQPLFTLPSENCPWRTLLQMIQEFLSVFFAGLTVSSLPLVEDAEQSLEIVTRTHSVTQQKQWLVSSLYRKLRRLLPKDGCCIVGLSWTDLYPSQALNFVLGEGSYPHSSAVVSFGRFEPKLYVEEGFQPAPIERIDGALLWKLFRVMSHETCHVFGMAHCLYFECSMNESSSVKEALDQPLLLCVVCLRKMRKVCRFDLVERYERMKEFLLKVNSVFPYEKFGRTVQQIDCVLLFLKAEGLVVKEEDVNDSEFLT